MYILLNKVVQYGNIVSYSVFDTDTLGVREVQNLNNVYYSTLDNYYNMDIFSCELNGSGLYILGTAKIKGNKYYIISFGSSYYFVTDKDFIVQNKTEYSNFIINKDGKIRFKNCAIPDLSDKFVDTGFILVNNMFDTSVNSSGGVSAKFFGRTLDNKYYGMVKFARAYSIDGSDVINEVVIYELGKLLGVPVCKAILGKVGNRQCVMSVYCYDTNKESICSFYKESLRLGAFDEIWLNDTTDTSWYRDLYRNHPEKIYDHY